MDSDAITAVALSALLLEGLIEFKDDEQFRLTEKGIDYAYELLNRFEPKDKAALLMLAWDIESIAENGNEG